jgi:hypothetical protein
MDNRQSDNLTKMLGLSIVLVGMFFTYEIVSALYISRTTALLTAASQDTNAYLVVTQPGHTSAYIGRGEGSIRLKPGDYILVAKDKNNASVRRVNLSKGTKVNFVITPTQYVGIPSVSDINFNNFDALTNVGVTSGEINQLQLALFQKFNRASGIEILNKGLVVAPHDRYSASTDGSVSFSMLVDNKHFSAKLDYSVLIDNIHLVLIDAFGNKVYDYTPPSATGE